MRNFSIVVVVSLLFSACAGALPTRRIDEVPEAERPAKADAFAAPTPAADAGVAKPEPVLQSKRAQEAESQDEQEYLIAPAKSSVIIAQDAEIVSDPVRGARVLARILKGGILKEIGEPVGAFRKVMHRAGDAFIIGWVPADRVVSAAQPSSEEAKARFEAELANHSPVIRSLIREKKITPGMSKDAVELAWGKPKRRLILERDTQIEEKWIYDDAHLRFNNGLLEDWVQQ